MRFALHLRVPGWAEGATLAIDNGAAESIDAGTFCRVDREWPEQSELHLRFPMRTAVQRRFNNSVTIERGPLVYALAVDEEWRPVAPVTRSAPTTDERVAYDYEVYPTAGWNYTLDIDPALPDTGVSFEITAGRRHGFFGRWGAARSPCAWPPATGVAARTWSGGTCARQPRYVGRTARTADTGAIWLHDIAGYRVSARLR